MSLADALANATASGAPYTHVVLLAGTNDLGRLNILDAGGRTPAAVLADVRALHASAHAANASTVAVTVPQPAFESSHPHVAHGRAAINAGLHAFAALSNDTVLLADADRELPNLTAPESIRRVRWEPDGLHFTPAGYDELASVVHSALTRAGVQACDASRQTLSLATTPGGALLAT